MFLMCCYQWILSRDTAVGVWTWMIWGCSRPRPLTAGPACPPSSGSFHQPTCPSSTRTSTCLCALAVVTWKAATRSTARTYRRGLAAPGFDACCFGWAVTACGWRGRCRSECSGHWMRTSLQSITTRQQVLPAATAQGCSHLISNGQEPLL